MPKMKTHRASAKRFKRTASGKLKDLRLIRAILLVKNHQKESEI